MSKPGIVRFSTRTRALHKIQVLAFFIHPCFQDLPNYLLQAKDQAELLYGDPQPLDFQWGYLEKEELFISVASVALLWALKVEKYLFVFEPLKLKGPFRSC